MVLRLSDIFDPKDVTKIELELTKEDAELPCNIWGFIKKMKGKIEELEARIIELEKA